MSVVYLLRPLRTAKLIREKMVALDGKAHGCIGEFFPPLSIDNHGPPISDT